MLLQSGKMYYLDKVWARYNMTGDGLWTGHKKVYGALRNVTLYDLELLINPSVKRNIIRKNRYALTTLLNEFNDDCYEDILPIITPLDASVFKTTFLLSKKRPYTITDRYKRMMLRLQVFINLLEEKIHLI